MAGHENSKNHRRSVLILAALAVGMFGVGFALVPVYNLICKVAGIQTITQPVAAQQQLESPVVDAQPGQAGRWVTVKFDTTINSGLPWEVRPDVRRLRVKTGQVNEVNYVARNLSDEPVTGQAIPSVVPWQATDYFSKIECFCFRQQELQGHEVKVLSLRFLVNPDLPPEINSLTLSYSIMNTRTDDASASTGQRVAHRRG